jgi:hypothetical protein
MHSLFPVAFASFWILALGLVEILLLRLLNKVWWQRRWIRRSAIALPIVGTLAVVAWGAGEYLTISFLALAGGVMVALTFVLEACLMFSLPLSGIIHGVEHFLHRRHQKKLDPAELPANPNRRLFLQGAAAALPVITLSMGTAGVGRSLGKINLPLRKLTISGLPANLENLRILQISDTHLWHYVTLDDLSGVCEDAAEYKPDLVLVTGDIADDLKLLPDALRIIAELKPALGVFATLGNHEYFRGVEAVRRIFDRSAVPLFINQGVRIESEDRALYLAGIDDPRRLSLAPSDFFERTIDQSLADRNPGQFTVLMSHRPDALDYASTQKIGLTLAGHTHGGQVGIFGRSVFEPAFPERYLWGTYRRGDSALYTTSGAGHWFPFRLGCPPEAPIIELHSA